MFGAGLGVVIELFNDHENISFLLTILHVTFCDLSFFRHVTLFFKGCNGN